MIACSTGAKRVQLKGCLGDLKLGIQCCKHQKIPPELFGFLCLYSDCNTVAVASLVQTYIILR